MLHTSTKVGANRAAGLSEHCWDGIFSKKRCPYSSAGELQAFQQRSATSPSPGAVRPETDEQVGDIHALLVAELSQQVTDLNEELSRAKRKIKKLQRPQRAPSSAGALLEGSGHMRSDSFQGQHSPFMFST